MLGCSRELRYRKKVDVLFVDCIVRMKVSFVCNSECFEVWFYLDYRLKKESLVSFMGEYV